MIETTVIEQDGGFVGVAVLDDGTVATPMRAPVRSTVEEATEDTRWIEMSDTGPVYRHFYPRGA